MRVLGIGNAIVDVICKVEDKFISQNSLTKSTMKLVDEIEFKKLLSTLKIEETISGGSVANSIVGLSQLGNKVGFIGKISDDNLGNKYEEGLKKENVKCQGESRLTSFASKQFCNCKNLLLQVSIYFFSSKMIYPNKLFNLSRSLMHKGRFPEKILLFFWILSK